MADSPEAVTAMDWSPTYTRILSGSKRKLNNIVDESTPFSRDAAFSLQHHSYQADDHNFYEDDRYAISGLEPPPNAFVRYSKNALIVAYTFTYVVVATTYKVLRGPVGYTASGIKRRLISMTRNIAADDRPTTPRRRKCRNIYLTPRQHYELRSARSRKLRDMPGRFPTIPLGEYIDKPYRKYQPPPVKMPPPDLRPMPDMSRLPGAFIESPMELKQQRLNSAILKKKRSLISWPFGSRVKKNVNFNESPRTGRLITRTKRYVVGEAITHPSPNTTVDESSVVSNHSPNTVNHYQSLLNAQLQPAEMASPERHMTTATNEPEHNQASGLESAVQPKPESSVEPEPESAKQPDPAPQPVSQLIYARTKPLVATRNSKRQLSKKAKATLTIESEPDSVKAPPPKDFFELLRKNRRPYQRRSGQASVKENINALLNANVSSSEDRSSHAEATEASDHGGSSVIQTVEASDHGGSSILQTVEASDNGGSSNAEAEEASDKDGSSHTMAADSSDKDDSNSSTGSLNEPFAGLGLDPRRITVREQKLAEQRAAREAEEKVRAEKEAAELEAQLAREIEEDKKRRGVRQFTKEPIIAPFSAEQEERLNRAMARGQKITAMNNIELTSRDWKTVLPTDAWLNDNIINAYLDYVVQMAHDRIGLKRNEGPKMHAFNNNFYNNLSKNGYTSVARWARRAKIAGKTLLTLDYIFIPVNASNNHWTLAVISPARHTIEYFDSLHMSSMPARVISHLREWLKGELGDAYVANEWTIRNDQSPHQGNMSDCGVHTVTTAKLIALGIDPMAAPAAAMPLQRRRIVAELLNSGFHGEFEPRFEFV